MQDLIVEFSALLESVPQKLKAFEPSASRAETEAVPGQEWSPREIVGHLIDSASNNHLRFVMAQLYGEARLPSYEQEEWVKLQRYEAEPWERLVTLWENYNRHLLHLIASTPAAKLQAICYIGQNSPMTLQELMYDYLRHLKHHLQDLPKF